jgi:hypothetical protein
LCCKSMTWPALASVAAALTAHLNLWITLS